MYSTRHSTMAIIAALSLLGGCDSGGQNAQDPSAAKDVARPIKIVTIAAQSTSFPRSFPAVVAAARTASLTFQVNGLLTKMLVLEGQEVKKGDLIAELDRRSYRNQYNSAKAQFTNANVEYKRAKTLAKQNAISRSGLDQRRSNLDVARAQLDTAKKALEDTRLRAPFAGQIASVSVEKFQNVSPGQAVVQLQSSGRIDAVVNVPASILAYMPQLEPISTSVRLDAAPGVDIKATFKEASGKADPATQTYEARFSFDAPKDLLILPGMTGAVHSQLRYTGKALDNAVRVPTGSVFSEGSSQFVWVIDSATMKVSKRQIKVFEERLGEQVTVSDGLKAGEKIAGAGAAYLNEGMKVRAWNP